MSQRDSEALPEKARGAHAARLCCDIPRMAGDSSPAGAGAPIFYESGYLTLCQPTGWWQSTVR